ncbi:MAG: hypothetical protein GQ527_00370 [Bacteroidales bacterium]|nr:hypothetical protein [Bacteroidales bacterium]
MNRKIYLLTFLALMMVLQSIGQESTKEETFKRSFGLSGSIQGNQFGILIPIWLGQKFVIAPSFEIKIAESIGGDYSFGLSPRYYFKTEKLSPYAGLKIGTLLNTLTSENENSSTVKIDYLFGLAFGAEYFLSNNFSFGVEAQANMTKSDENSYRFGNPGGIVFNTGTMITASVYF